MDRILNCNKNRSILKIAMLLNSACLFLLFLYSTEAFTFKLDKLTAQEKRRIESWEQLLKSTPPNTEIKILKKVNRFFNELRFIPDTPYLGSDDHWLTPYEFLKTGGGDCEDFAIAKYFTSIALGIPSKKLRITYVTIKQRNIAHMVLAYYPEPDSEPLILDNINKLILPASNREELKPVYSFSIDDVWLQQRMDKSKYLSSATSLSKWQALLKRFEQQCRLRNISCL
jgi:predicted transglutaminase-like cysteine proteinase